MTLRFTSAQAENDFIDDNGHHDIAKHDKNGVAYYADRSAVQTSTPHKQPSAAKKAAATTARKSIKQLGYRAMSGTPKQKSWAEQIRKSIVDNLPEDIQAAFVDAPFKTAKFWIDNKDKSASDFADFAREDNRLHDEIWALHAEGKLNEVRELRETRQALQYSWGV